MSANPNPLPPTPGAFLQRRFFERTQRNARYSLRAFARDLGLSHSFLSLVLNEKRRLHPRRATELAKRMDLSPALAAKFVEIAQTAFWSKGGEVQLPKEALPAAFRLELDRFKTLSEWYHVAILDLVELPDFRPSFAWIASALGITPSQAKSAVQRLGRLGLLEISDRGWKKTHALMVIPAQAPAAAIRKFHRQMIGKALKALGSTKPEDFEARHIVGSTMAIDRSRLPEAKRRVAKFRRSLLRYLSGGVTTDLYQLNLQLFPIYTGTKGNLRAN